MESTEIAPKPGTTFSARKKELDEVRFVAVRKLATMIYKNPDGTPLVAYLDSLKERDLVKNAVLNFELSQGMIHNDGTQPVPSPTTGPVMTIQAPPAFTPPVMNMAAPQQQMIQPSLPAMPPQPPPAMEAPQAEAAAPRKSRRAIAGASVAPPPESPPMNPQAPQVNTQMSVPFQPPTFQPPAFQPPAFQVPGQAVPPPVAAQPANTVLVDTNALASLMASVDKLGQGVQTATYNADQSLKATAELRRNQQIMITALWQIHATVIPNPNGPKNVADFATMMASFLPPG